MKQRVRVDHVDLKDVMKLQSQEKSQAADRM